MGVEIEHGVITLGHVMRADPVEALLDQAQNYPAGTSTAMTRERARKIIHTALWLYGVRSDSTSAAYGWSAWEKVVYGSDWSRWLDMCRELGLNPHSSHNHRIPDEVWKLRGALGLNPTWWTKP